MSAAIISAFLLVVAAAADPASSSLRGIPSQPDAVDVSASATPMAELAEAALGEDAPWQDEDAASADLAAAMTVADRLSEGNTSEDGLDGLEALLLLNGGWHQGGDKMWGSGSGVEVINGGNVGFYNSGMAAAHSRCGGPSCALLCNPPGHRSVETFHIHFVHYSSYGVSLKKKLESMVCGRSGWQAGGLPCGGKAAFFPGFPGVFSAAMGAGGLGHACVIAWPASCGGRGTIVELAYGCSLEHQIRGDYNPALR